MSLLLGSSGGGIITLQEPTTATNRTLTLPDVTATLAHINGRFEYIGTNAVRLDAGTLSFTNISAYSQILAITQLDNRDNTGSNGISVALSSNNGSTYGTARTIVSFDNTNYSAEGSVTISNTNVVGNKTISPYLIAGNQNLYTTTATENVVTGTINALRFANTASSDIKLAVSLFGIL